MRIQNKKRELLIFLTFVLGTGLFFGLAWAQSAIEGHKSAEICKVELVSTQQQGQEHTQAQAQEQANTDSTSISMDFQDANLKDVLKVFSQQSGLNFIAGEAVKDRKVTLYLDNVPIEGALETIMNANNLAYEQQAESNIFIVKELGLAEIETVTKVFPLQYAKVKGYELTAAGEKSKETKQIGIKDIVERQLTEHGRASEDARTNSLIITDVPGQFERIEQTIKELDVKLPQVLIEAEVIETSLQAIDRLGIEWGSASEGELLSAYGAARSVTYPFSKPQEMRKVGPEGDVSGLYLGYVSAMNLGGALALLDKDTDTRILARPKILTLNNETAEITIVAQTAIASETQEVRTGEGLGQAITKPERVETGVSLKVTPQINARGEITMIIEPSVTSTSISQYFNDFVDPETRSARTTVTVSDGETVIIGGLIKTEETKLSRKVPFVGDIPFLGHLFSRKDDTKTDKELIIFITPRLVKDKAIASVLKPQEEALTKYENLSRRDRAMETALDRFED